MFKERLKKCFIKKRYEKVKKISVNKNYGDFQVARPLHIVDGDESKTGTGSIEIAFDKIENSNDIRLEWKNGYDVEEIDISGGNILYWPLPEFEADDTLKLYYGRKNHLLVWIHNKLV